MRNRIKEPQTELKGGNQGRGAEDETLNAERRVDDGSTKLVNQEIELHSVSSETQKIQLPADECSSASTTLQTAVSDSPSLLTEEQSQQKEKVDEHNVTNSITFRPQLRSQPYGTYS